MRLSGLYSIYKAQSAAAIVRTIIMLGHSLGLKMIAEGAETVGQARFLRQNGCDEMEGFLIERALPAQDPQTLFLHPRRGLFQILQGRYRREN